MEKKEFTIANILEHPIQGNQEFQSAFADFLSMRKKIKRPATERAQRLLMLKLVRLSQDDEALAIKIVDRSIVNCWQDFYPLKTN